MRRIKLVLAALVVMVAVFAAFASPAMAQSISVGNVGTGFTAGNGLTTLNNIGTTGLDTLNSTLNGTLNGTFLGLNGNVLGPGFVGGGTVVF